MLQACRNNHDFLASQYNVRLGLAYLGQGNVAVAKAKLLRALAQSPGAANVNSALAFFMEKTGETWRADKLYRQAIRLSSNSGLEFNNYADFLCRQKEYQKANRYFMLAVNDVHYADTAKAYESAGICNLLAKQDTTAVNNFKQALLKDPKRKSSLSALVKIYLRDNNIYQVCALLARYAQTLESEVNLTRLIYKFCKSGLVN